MDNQQTTPEEPLSEVPTTSFSSKIATYFHNKKIIFIAVTAVIVLTVALGYIYFNLLVSKEAEVSKSQQDIQKLAQKEIPNRFVHFKYLHKPTFAKTVPSSFAQAGEYSIKDRLPSAQELVKKSKISFLPIAYAGGEIHLPVYKANRHEVTASDAKNLAQRFGFSEEPRKDGFAPPAYYGFIWETDNAYFQVSGGSGSGGFEYYLKGPGLSRKAPSDDEATAKAKEFLSQKGIIDDSYIVSGIHYNVSDISKRTGFREDHKQVYFRKNLQGYPAYAWHIGGGSPIVDRVEVWVGSDGRIIYATDSSYWTTVNLDDKADYLVREPSEVFEDVKAGKGKLAWIDWDAIGVSTGGYGPHAPDGDFLMHGRLRNVVIESVDLAYYHEEKGIEEPEFYQPVYVFKAQATLDWKADYAVDYEADKFIQGKRTSVALAASAVPNNYFFENPVLVGESKPVEQVAPVPVYYPPVVEPTPTVPTSPKLSVPTPTSPPVKQNFILKLGVVTELEDPKRNIVLSWEEVPGTVKYNVYLKIAGDANYNQTAVVGTGELSTTLGVNKYIDYYFKVKACSSGESCIESNEVFLPQAQKPTFYMKLGVVTPGEDPKTEVTLSWSEYPGTVKYNVFLRNSQTEEYGTALTGTGELSYIATVNRHNDNYFIVQACNNETCYPSNEIFLPKQ